MDFARFFHSTHFFNLPTTFLRGRFPSEHSSSAPRWIMHQSLSSSLPEPVTTFSVICRFPTFVWAPQIPSTPVHKQMICRSLSCHQVFSSCWLYSCGYEVSLWLCVWTLQFFGVSLGKCHFVLVPQTLLFVDNKKDLNVVTDWWSTVEWRV